MKSNIIPRIGLLALAIFCGQQTGFTQGTFVNLNFESARVILDPSSPYYPNAINASNALPGWTVTGSFSAPDVLYNDVSLGAAAVSLQGTNGVEPALQGNYSVLLQGSTAGGPAGVSIGQTGQVSLSTESLRFYGYNVINLQVTFDGQNLPYNAIGTGPNCTIYGADISAYAGQTGELLFSALPNGAALLDNIQFSTSPVPEPTVGVLFLCGAGVFGANRWRRRFASSKFKV